MLASFAKCMMLFTTLKSQADALIKGAFLRPVNFEPTSGKWQGIVCKGFQIHVTQPNTFLPYRTSLAVLQAAILLYAEQFQYKQPPYEYEFKRLPMDLILGDRDVRIQLEKGKPVLEIEQSWQQDLYAFDRTREKYFLYK